MDDPLVKLMAMFEEEVQMSPGTGKSAKLKKKLFSGTSPSNKKSKSDVEAKAKTHATKLLSSVTVHLHTQINQKTKLKLESMLNHITYGIECNLSVKHSSVSRSGKLERDAEGVQRI
ncbi:hypothetical protein ACS0TY_006192 [Phlomoides rotata]